MSLLAEIGETLTDALVGADLPGDCVVTRTETVDPGTPWDPSDDTSEDVPYDCQGWRDEYQQSEIDGTVIQQGDARVYVVASTLAITPTTADKVTIGGKTYVIQSIGLDPAGACWVLQARFAGV